MPTLEEKINKEPEKKEVEKKEIIEKEKEKESENKNEISKENLDKKDKKEKKVEIEVLKRPRDLLGFSLVPKHSFLINLGRSNSIFNINEDGEGNKDKLNTSFTMKLSDDLKENVLKMRNPKMKNPNKEKEINKALQEIKQQKGTSSVQSKKVESNKGKNKKAVKISNEPLFKENKRKDHTIIHNRNASAMGVEKRGNNEENGRQKRKASVNKINTKNLKNPGGIDLKNNMKRIKKENKEKDNKEKENKEKENKDKSKEKNIKSKTNKDIENSYSAKKRNISMFDINSNEKSKKSSVNIRKNNIPKPMTSRKNEKNSSMVILTTTSNTKPHHVRKNVSVTKKINNNYSNKNILKTPSKNIEKKNLETIYKNSNTTNIHIKKKENPSGILNKTIQLSDVKKNSQRSKIPFDKNSNKKKNIRIAFKNIEEEDIDLDKDKNKEDTDTNKEDKEKAKTYTEMYNKNKSSKGNVTSNIKTNNISTTINNSVSANNINLNGGKKKKINHNKSHSIREIIYTNKNNNGYLYTHNNNESTMSYRNINYNRSISRKDHDIPKNKNRYQSVIKTERNEVKTKKYFNMSGYEGTKTEVINEKNGNSKYLNDTKTGKKLKNFYYGPIDIKNIVIGSSLNQIIEKLTEILIKHRVKYWKLNQLKFYCNKNGEIFVIEIFNLSNKIIINSDKDKKEEKEVSEFDIENSENKDKNQNDNKKNNKSNMIFYVTVLSKDSSNKGQAKNINKIINKKFGEIFKK